LAFAGPLPAEWMLLLILPLRFGSIEHLRNGAALAVLFFPIGKAS
jgi:hypothetical protein